LVLWALEGEIGEIKSQMITIDVLYVLFSCYFVFFFNEF
jgi:hypothetical protein